MRPLLPEPPNDDFRPERGDAIAAYFATRGWRRFLAATASGLAAVVLTLSLVQAFQPSPPRPELATVSPDF